MVVEIRPASGLAQSAAALRTASRPARAASARCCRMSTSSAPCTISTRSANSAGRSPARAAAWRRPDPRRWPAAGRVVRSCRAASQGLLRQRSRPRPLIRRIGRPSDTCSRQLVRRSASAGPSRVGCNCEYDEPPVLGTAAIAFLVGHGACPPSRRPRSESSSFVSARRSQIRSDCALWRCVCRSRWTGWSSRC